MGDLATSVFDAKTSGSRSLLAFASGMEVVMFVNIPALGRACFRTATDSSISGYNETSGYQPTVHGNDIASFPCCALFAIQKVNILPGFTYVPYAYEGKGMEPRESLADIRPSGSSSVFHCTAFLCG